MRIKRSDRAPRIAVIVALMAAAGCVAIAGCGYTFGASGSNLPRDAKTIYVARFDNLTRRTGINDIFMRYVDDEIDSHHRLRVVANPSEADLELTGDIVTATPLPASFNSVLEPTIYNQNMTVRASLKDLRTNKIIWSGSGLGYTAHAPVVAQAVVPTTPEFVQGNLRAPNIAQMTDLQVAQTQTDLAQDTMMRNVAQNLYASMAEGF